MRVNGGTRTFTRRPRVPNERATSERTVVLRPAKMMTPIRPLLCVLLLVAAVLESTHGRGQTYLEPVLEPISSTVVSVPMYKLSRGLEIGPVDRGRVDKTTLLTAKNINKLKDGTRGDERAKVKSL